MGNLMTVIVTAAKDSPAHRADLAKIVLLRAPPVWDNHAEVRQLFGAMTTTPTRWNSWINYITGTTTGTTTIWNNWISTSKVKELMMGETNSLTWRQRLRSQANGVTDEWLDLVGSGKFSQLTSLNLSNCGKITDAGVIQLAHKCSQLTSLDLTWCESITDACVMHLRQTYPRLTILGDGSWYTP